MAGESDCEPDALDSSCRDSWFFVFLAVFDRLRSKQGGRMMRRSSRLAVLMVFGLYSNLASPESDFLDAEELRELYSGAMVEGKSSRGYSYRQTYKPDGTLIGEIIDSGQAYEARWWIETDGQACTDTNRFGVRCRKVKHISDVEYELFTETGATYRARFVNKGDLAEKLKR